MKVIRTDKNGERRTIDTDREHGLMCRQCGCRDFRTVDTAHVGDHVRRVRVCRNCGERGKTAEKFLA